MNAVSNEMLCPEVGPAGQAVMPFNMFKPSGRKEVADLVRMLLFPLRIEELSV